MGFWEALILALVILMAFAAMFRGRSGVSRGDRYRHPPKDEDAARVRQMKEWDRFDDTKSGRS